MFGAVLWCWGDDAARELGHCLFYIILNSCTTHKVQVVGGRMKVKEQKIMREFFKPACLSWSEYTYAQFYTFSIPKVLSWLRLIQLMTFRYYTNLSNKRLTLSAYSIVIMYLRISVSISRKEQLFWGGFLSEVSIMIKFNWNLTRWCVSAFL